LLLGVLECGNPCSRVNLTKSLRITSRSLPYVKKLNSIQGPQALEACPEKPEKMAMIQDPVPEVLKRWTSLSRDLKP